MKPLLLSIALAAFAVAAQAGDGQGCCSESQHTSGCAKDKVMTSTQADCPECPMAAQTKAKIMTSTKGECPMATQTKTKVMTSTAGDCPDCPECPMAAQTKATCPYASTKVAKHTANKPLQSPKALALANR